MLLSQMDCSKCVPRYPEVELFLLDLNLELYLKKQRKKTKKKIVYQSGLWFRHFTEVNAAITPACITINLKTAKDIEGKHQSPRLPEFYVVLSGDSVINFWLQHFPGCHALRRWLALCFWCCEFSANYFMFFCSKHPDHFLSVNEKLYEWNYFC